MSEDGSGRAVAYKFVWDRIDSVPQLEALLLLWNSRPRQWTSAEVAARLYISEDVARSILQDLAYQQLTHCTFADGWKHNFASISEEQDRIVETVAETYQREMVPISTMIHSKASRAVRDFARAFRFTKENE